MSEEAGGSGFGAFLLGVSVGAVLGFLFAPGPGQATRGRLGRKLRGLREFAADEARELGVIVGDAAEAGAEEAPTARAALERRLAQAKHRRRAGKSGGTALPSPASQDDEEDEPVA
jgi:gas vesicle protein